MDRIREGAKVEVTEPGAALRGGGASAGKPGDAADPAKASEYRKRLEAMTPEQREEMKKKREAMTPEQREEFRKRREAREGGKP